MGVSAIKKPTAGGEPLKARELMEKLNVDAEKSMSGSARN